jgi:hypothetical protein
MKQIIRHSVLAFFVSGMLLGASAHAQSAGQDMKNAGHDTVQATKKTTHKAVRGTKKGVQKTAHATKRGARKVERKTDTQPQ